MEEINRKESFLKANVIIAIINIIIFVISNLWFLNDIDYIYDLFSLYWVSIIKDKEYYRLITGMFLHSGIEHLCNNMLILLIIGNILEDVIGRLRYIIIYFGSGIIAGIASITYNMINQNNTFSIGASGAIFGTIGAMFVVSCVTKGRIRGLTLKKMLIFVFFSIYAGFTNIGVDNIAHIGGFIAGVVITLFFIRIIKDKEDDNES